MIKPLFTLNRTELNKVIEELSLFAETKKTIKAYEKEELKLDERKERLESRLADLNIKLAKNTQEQQIYRNVDDLIYLQTAAKEINKETAIIETLLDELAEEYQALKLKFAPAFKDASQKDNAEIGKIFNVTETLELLKFDLLKALVDLKKALNSEMYQVLSANEVLSDRQVNEKFRTTYNVISSDRVKPIFSYPYPYLVDRNEVWVACDGNINMNDPRPKEESKGEDNEV